MVESCWKGMFINFSLKKSVLKDDIDTIATSVWKMCGAIISTYKHYTHRHRQTHIHTHTDTDTQREKYRNVQDGKGDYYLKSSRCFFTTGKIFSYGNTWAHILLAYACPSKCVNTSLFNVHNKYQHFIQLARYSYISHGTYTYHD